MTEQPPPEDRLHPADARSWRSLLRTFVCGLAMGTSDAVPGVSGGTIALILGIYPRFIGSLGHLVDVVRAPRAATTWRRVIAALWFLVPLGAGLASAYLAATRLLVGSLEKPTDATWRAIDATYAATPPTGWLVNPTAAPYTFAFFFGLVLFSVHEPWKEKHGTKSIDFVLAAVGAILAVALSLSPPGAGSTSPLMLIASGAIGVSVMLLPGVSGSLALLVLGMYQIVSGAPHAGAWDVVAWFLLGIVLGAALFVPLLRWMLVRVHDRTMSFLTGLMLGSLAALWPWKAHYLPLFIRWKGPMSPLPPPSSGWWGPVIAVAVGGAVIVVMGRVARRVNAVPAADGAGDGGR